MPTGAEEVAAAKAAVAIVQIAQKQGLLTKLRDAFRTKNKILVLGSTGCGKSNFIDSLQVLVPQAIDNLKRTQWASTERVKLGDNMFDFTDTPGQTAHRSRRLDAITDAMRQDRFGVINVTSWGYHEYATGAKEALLEDGSPNPTWLETHRKVEIDAVTEWVPLLAGRPSFLITLVSKADLWWSQRDAALLHYEHGPYFAAVRDAAIQGHLVLPYSSVGHMFYSDGVMDGTFQSRDREKCQQRFLEDLFIATARR